MEEGLILATTGLIAAVILGWRSGRRRDVRMPGARRDDDAAIGPRS
jgi:hypothetical protein